MWRHKAEQAGLGGLLWLVLIASAVGQGTPPQATTPQVATKTATATFAGGCFWCVEADFDKVDGVISTISGYIGGRTANPSYEDVSRGGTGHAEAVEIVYDPAKVSYQKLLDVFWHNIDPLVKDRQFCDHGASYHPAIFWRNERQHTAAETSRKAIEKQLGKPVATFVRQAGPFWRAEEYHQDFYKKSAAHYHAYSMACGRDRTLDELWGKQATHAVVE